MDNAIKQLKRLPYAAQTTAKRLWARWFGDEESIIETTYWPLQDALASAQACRRSAAQGQDAFPESVLQTADPRFIGRESALESLQAALDVWRAGHASMVAVHGPQGAGISSLLAQIPGLTRDDETLISERFCNRLRDTDDVIRLFAQTLGLETVPASIEALIDTLQQLEPRIIVLDDAHLLAFRVMGTRTAVRSFGSVLVATQPRHLWILGFRRHAWRRLVYMHQADRYFSHSIELDFLTTEELKAAVTSRLMNSQVEIDWSNQQWQRLHDYSRGKPDLAFLYSRLLCNPPQTGEDQPEILRPIDLSSLKSLEMEDLFTLAELAVHGNLRCEEHRVIFRETPEGSLMRLEHLCNRGLVERFEPDCGERDPHYRVTPLLSGLIAEHLYKLNYLY